MTLAAGKYMVLCENEEVFSAIHASVPTLIGDLGFGLGNGSDVIRLYDASGQLQLSVCYGDVDPWITAADGEGYTLELTDPNANLNDAASWFAGCLGGSPGGPYDPNCLPVSVRPITGSDALSIYPNPFDQSLVIHLREDASGTIRIMDVYGKIILQQPVSGQTTTVQTNAWSAGIYFVMTETNGIQLVEKVMKR